MLKKEGERKKMKNGNEENIIIDEDSYAGPEIQKRSFYQNKLIEINLHLKRKESYPYIENKNDLKERGININYEAAPYFIKWNREIIKTFLPLTDKLGLDLLIFADEQFTKYMKIIQDTISKNSKEIKQVEIIKDKTICKISKDTESNIKSVIAE
jgi:hypothetical protein